MDQSNKKNRTKSSFFKRRLEEDKTTVAPRPYKKREEEPARNREDKPVRAREEKPERAKPSKPYGAKEKTGPVRRNSAPDRGSKRVPVEVKEMRLNRFIAMSGVCSRREADELIASGEVTVNGVVADQLGTKIRTTDEIRLSGQLLRGEKKVYILMNKPKGYVTTMEDPHADKTVIDLLKGKVKERVYPVGRLDKNTTGVLLLTNDGDLTKELTHPSFEKKKIYHVFLDKPCKEDDLIQLEQGITLEDGFIKADQISYVDGIATEIGIELHSGRNRIVRRMFESMGYDVIKLDRVYFAGLTKSVLKRGFWRFLTDREVSMLKSGKYD